MVKLISVAFQTVSLLVFCFGTEWSSMKSAALKARMLCFCAFSRSGCLGDTSALWEGIWHVWANCMCFPVSMWNPGSWCVSSAHFGRYPASRPDVVISSSTDCHLQITVLQHVWVPCTHCSDACTCTKVQIFLEVCVFRDQGLWEAEKCMCLTAWHPKLMLRVGASVSQGFP